MSANRPHSAFSTPGSRGCPSGRSRESPNVVNDNLNAATSRTKSSAGVSRKRSHDSDTADIEGNRRRPRKQRKTYKATRPHPDLVHFNGYLAEKSSISESERQSTDGKHQKLLSPSDSYDISNYDAEQQLTFWEGMDLMSRLKDGEIQTFHAADTVFTGQDGERKVNDRGGLITQCAPLLKTLFPMNSEDRSRASSNDGTCTPGSPVELADASLDNESDLLDYFGSDDINFSGEKQQLSVPEGLAVIESLDDCEIASFKFSDLVLTWQNGERKLEYVDGLSQCLLEILEKLGPTQYYIGSRATSMDNSICTSPVPDMPDSDIENDAEEEVAAYVEV